MSKNTPKKQLQDINKQSVGNILPKTVSEIDKKYIKQGGKIIKPDGKK